MANDCRPFHGQHQAEELEEMRYRNAEMSVEKQGPQCPEIKIVLLCAREAIGKARPENECQQRIESIESSGKGRREQCGWGHEVEDYSLGTLIESAGAIGTADTPNVGRGFLSATKTGP